MSKTLELPLERKIFFSSQVNQTTISDLTKKIIDINDSDKQLKAEYKLHNLEYNPKPIEIYIDSYGGAVYQCYGLLSIMELSKTPIHTIVTGAAMSCGFMILICGHKRFAYKDSTAMYHQISTGAVGKLKDIEEDLIEGQRLQMILEEKTLRNTKLTRKLLNKVYKNKKDWFINSEDCVKYGIVDEIIS